MLDQMLVNQTGKHEYDFRLLVLAATSFYSRELTIKESVYEAVFHSKENSTPQLAMVIDEAYYAFKENLKAIPSLFPDVETVLYSIRKTLSDGKLVATVLFSEGNPSRIEHILEAHKIRQRGFFDEIIIETKSKETFEKAKKAGLKHLPKGGNPSRVIFVLTGDSLKQDIKFGNQTGFITVYKPSSFKGYEKPRALDEQPCYIINKLSELLAVIQNIIRTPGECPARIQLAK
jgi:FMN phosphatase YigB (HAD superfamily)